MKRYVLILLLFAVLFDACSKNNLSKIPHISLVALVPQDSFIINVDTAFYMVFKFTDGDGDLSNDTNSGVYIKDSRFPALGFTKNLFPTIDAAIENPKNGLSGTCYFFPLPQPAPRGDSIHQLEGDTLAYEFYITDRAGNQSNHIITSSYVVRL